MMTNEEIVQYARTHKDKIQHYYYHVLELFKEPAFEGFKKHEFNALFLLSIETPLELCKFLKLGIYQLETIINYPVYKKYTIKKKKGGHRQIFAPSKRLKKIQKQLNYFLQAYYLIIKPEAVHGFVINPNYLDTRCNILENAKAHTDKKQVLNMDLKDFFPSISAMRVKELFTSKYFRFNEQMATALTLLSTYEGKLPIGSPLSPVISNFICLSLDRDLKQFAETHNLAYSRYADDLTFSSDAEIPSDVILDIINLIKKNNFSINTKKLRLKTDSRKQTVTGLTVNEKVNVDRKLLKKIRAMLHDWTKNGLHEATRKHFGLKRSMVGHEIKTKFLNRLEGYICFVGQVRGKDDSLYLKYKSSFDFALSLTVHVKEGYWR